MSDNTNNTPQQEPTLVGMKTCLNLVFNDEATRPSPRTFAGWKAKGYFPTVKIGRRVFCDPVAVRQAIEARFTIKAN